MDELKGVSTEGMKFYTEDLAVFPTPKFKTIKWWHYIIVPIFGRKVIKTKNGWTMYELKGKYYVM